MSLDVDSSLNVESLSLSLDADSMFLDADPKSLDAALMSLDDDSQTDGPDEGNIEGGSED